MILTHSQLAGLCCVCLITITTTIASSNCGGTKDQKPGCIASGDPNEEA